MRIAVISDVHANAIALEAVIKYIEERHVDEWIFLGDLVMNGPRPQEAFHKLKELSPIAWIKGNTDSWFEEIGDDFKPSSEREELLYSLFLYTDKQLTVDEKAFLVSRPEKQLVEIEGMKILCTHGSHRSMNEQIGLMTPTEKLEQLTKEIDAEILLCGHTHSPYYASLNGKKIINVGAVSLSFDGDTRASFGILEINEEIISYENHRVSYDIPRVIDMAKKSDFPQPEVFIKKLTLANPNL
ncbi:MAG: metallophosphoesterase family protein [Bacillota bacterium]